MTPEIAALVDEMVPRARSVAWRHFHRAPHALELDELVALALRGLAEAGARWETYCSEHGYSPAATGYFKAYALRRMNGAILDAMRGADWLTRSARQRARALREADAPGRDDAAVAADAGLTPEQVRETREALARRPVSFDPAAHDMPDSDGDVESSITAADLVSQGLAALRSQPAPAQVAVALVHYCGLSLPQAAQLLCSDPAEVAAAYAGAVTAVHSALASAASS